jgi:hypothetical protein
MSEFRKQTFTDKQKHQQQAYTDDTYVSDRAPTNSLAFTSIRNHQYLVRSFIEKQNHHINKYIRIQYAYDDHMIIKGQKYKQWQLQVIAVDKTTYL